MLFDKMLLAIASILIFSGGFLWFSKGPNQFPLEPTAVNTELLKSISQELAGDLLFDSNRSGTFGIYTQGIGSEEVRTLVDSELQEMYPDASADGSLIVYARHTSLERDNPGEIWLMAADGSNQRRLAENGTFPTFSKDGSKVFFERERGKVMSVPTAGGEAVELFPAQHTDWHPFMIVKPRVSADETHVYFTTDRAGRWNAYSANIETGERVHVGRGCEPTPFDSHEKVAWVTKSHVLSKSGIGVMDRGSLQRGKLHDAGPPYGHEYFPTLVQGDQFLLYAACPGSQHDHLSANYQVFVRDLRSNDVVRVTHDAFTNRWPKLLPKS